MGMQILQQGEYVGDLLHKVHHESLFASISAYNKSLFNNYWHCHENAHISFVLKGGCAEKKKNLYERLPGKATFYLTGEPHQIVTMHDSLHVNLEMGDAFFRTYELTEEAFGSMVHKTPDVLFLMLHVYKELIAADTYAPDSIKMLLLNFLQQAEHWRRDDSIPGWMKKVHELMNDQWSETLTLKDLSLAAGVHPVTVSAYFPRYFSCTFGSYMRKLKVERAIAMLKVPGASLIGVAYDCGFFDQSHFIRIFKQVTGFLPSQYQQL